MRLAIVGTVFAAALAVTSASAQSPQIVGNKNFCLKGTEKIECSFDTMAACQKGVKDKSTAGSEALSCVSRSEAR